MMQSSPLNIRRAIIWIGRLVLGGIFIYAGYSKAFLPNHTLWPLFFLKFSISTNLANFALQVEAFKLLPPWGVQFGNNLKASTCRAKLAKLVENDGEFG